MNQVPTLNKRVEWGISPRIYVMTIYHTCKRGHVCLDMDIENLVSPHIQALQLTLMQLPFENQLILVGIFGGKFWRQFL